MKKTQSNLKNRLKQYSKYLFLFLAILFLISLVRNVFKIFEAKKSIDEAKAKVEKLAKENKELSERLLSVQSENYTEKQLRDKLGMAKEGETVVILPEAETVKKLAPKVEVEDGVLPDPVWKHWLRLFY